MESGPTGDFVGVLFEGEPVSEDPAAEENQNKTNDARKIPWYTKATNNFFTGLKSALISQETEEALAQILSLLNTLLAEEDEQKYSTIDLLTSLLVLLAYYRTDHITSGVVEEDDDLLLQATYYWKFAAAAYGWMLLNGYVFQNKEKYILKGFASANSDVRAFCDHTGLQPHHLLTAQWGTGADFSSAHYVAWDPFSESVVVGVRGTMHAKDALTDLQGHGAPFLSGYAHAGMLRGASVLYGRLRPLLVDALRRFRGWRLVLVGHSLGAAVASLLGMRLHEERRALALDAGWAAAEGGVTVRVFAYAPPCCVTLDLSNQFRPVVSSFVLGYDVVPRVSYGSLARLKRQSLAVMRHLPGNVQRLRAGAGGTLGLGDAALAASVRAWLDDGGDEGGGAALGPTSLHDKMFPAGSLFHLLPPSPPPPAEAAESAPTPSAADGQKAGGDSGPASLAGQEAEGGSGEGKTNEEEGEWRMERTNFSFFADIIISPSMLTDHLPNTYETGFQGILRRQALRRKKAGPFFFVEPPSS